MVRNLHPSAQARGHHSWSVIFGMALDQFWFARNNAIFNHRSISIQSMLIKIKSLVSANLTCKANLGIFKGGISPRPYGVPFI